MKNTWVFGYGSLIWHPGFDYIEKHKATLGGWRRVFWQGSHDHRGTPESPGRVVTLIADATAACVGMVYLIDSRVAASTFDTLDFREKNGYDRVETRFSLARNRDVDGIVYIANQHNPAYLGEAPLEDIAMQIMASEGPSGPNSEYLFKLANALRKLGVYEEHVFCIEAYAKRDRHT